MKHLFLKKSGSRSLVIFFAGWGMDSRPFSELAQIDYDCAIVFDYNDFSLREPIAEGYTNIFIFAWSFGIYAASRWICDQKKRPALSVAINGTPYPVDDRYGIPEAIFKATADHLSENSLLKFFRRMCGTPDCYENFISHRPLRTIGSLHSELLSVYKDSRSGFHLFTQWDKAYISLKDRIFPPENQKQAWKQTATTIFDLEEAHYPADMTKIIQANLISKPLVEKKFGQSLPTYDSNAHVQKTIAEQLLKKWETADFRTDRKIYEIGCGTGLFTKLYFPVYRPSKILLNDIVPAPALCNGANSDIAFRQEDAEYAQLGNMQFDYIVSASALQWFENVRTFICRIKMNLADKGLIVFSSFGKNNLKELRPVSSFSLNYLSISDWKQALDNADLDIVELSETETTLRFSSLSELLRSLKHTGVNGIKTTSPLTKAKLRNLSETLQEADGTYRLTYNPIYIIARKKETIHK